MTVAISIHALREEGDKDAGAAVPFEAISIHALREEGDALDVGLIDGVVQFLSTPSARRATDKAIHTQYNRAYFYPRPPRGGRRYEFRSFSLSHLFLSTPSARRATEDEQTLLCYGLFLSTPSARRATSAASPGRPCCPISIHALREEGDSRPSP